MACKYFYDNKEYTFDEFASLLENGLADEFLSKNLISDTGVYAKKAPVDETSGSVKINASNANVNLTKTSSQYKGNPLVALTRQAQKMVKAMSKIAPNLSFTIHATEESWNNLAQKMAESGNDITGSDGFYDEETNEIHLNFPLMKKLGRLNTGYHEGYHPLTNALFNSRPDLRNDMFNQMYLMANDPSLSEEFRNQVNECMTFGEQYREEEGPESVMNEAIVEFLSRVSDGQIVIDENDKSLINHIKQFLNTLARMFNIGVFVGDKNYTVDNLLAFAKIMDSAIKEGSVIEFEKGRIPSREALKVRNQNKVQFSKAGTTQATVNGKEVNIPESVLASKTGIANAIDFAKSKVFGRNIEFKEAIQDLFKEDIEKLKEQYGNKFKPEVGNKEFKQYLTDAYLNESLISLESHPSAIGWYDLKVKATMDIMSLIHPELKTDKDMQDIFKIALAVTSNGNKVDDQFKETDRLYEDFKKTGKFDTSKSIGTQSAAIKSTLKFVNQALEQMSIAEFSKFLTSMYRAGDLKYKGKDGKAKNILSGFVADQMVYGASIFGPKIGNGFFMNLYGEFGQLTMDRWFMRQYGRLTGRLIERSQEKIDSAKSRLDSAIKNLSKEEKASFLSVSKGLDDLSNIEDVALKINKASTKLEKRELLQSTEKLDEVRKAANGLIKELSGEIEAPKGGKERLFITEIINDVKDKLKKEYNIDISVADLQAVNWYLEKALYNTSKSEAGEDSLDQLPDYEIAARNLAKQKYSIPDETINETVSRTVADNGLNRPGNEIPTRDNQDAVVEKLKKDIISLKESIELEKPESTKKKKSKIQKSLASEFVNKLNETKSSDPKQYWSVDSVSLEDAKEGTVIKTEAGYGFVSQSGDIKGVFKANKESAEKTGDEVLKKAVKAGGIKLDNFDGYLTKIYERNGFVIASRIPFNEEYAPDGWEKEAHGTPDVVAMVYDPYKQLDIEEKRFEDYGEGIDYRDSFVELAYANAITNEAMAPRVDPRPNDLVSASSIVYDMTEDGNGNYVFYTNTVTGKNADVNEEGMLELTTEKKSIQPSMVKIPFESTYPLDTNPLNLKPRIQKSIIGEKGAERLETASRNMNNLLVAKKMKSQKKSKQAIKTATGWELGADGLWRMEVTDSKFKYDNFQLNKIIDKAINEEFTYKLLPNVISNKDLFDAYPYLKDVSVTFGKTGWVRFSPTSRYNMSPTTAAVYLSAGPGHQHIIINSEVLKEKGTENVLSYIDHEIQHYIQEQEGFTQGSSSREEFDIIINKIDDKIFSDSSKPLEKRLAKRLNEIATERNNLMSNLNEENKQRASDLHKERLAIYDKYATDILKIGSTYEKAYKNYNNKYGEIEARNVETRRQIPFEERANLLLEATQDVKNKDAIFTSNDKKVISALEAYANKSIVQQAKKLGFVAVVDKDMEGNAVVMSDTVMPAEETGDTVHVPNKKKIQRSFGWAGSKGVQAIEIGERGRAKLPSIAPVPGNIKELSDRQQSAFNNNFRAFFTATQGNSEAAKSLQEALLGEESYVNDQINKIAIQISKLVKEFVNSDTAKQAGISEDTIHKIVDRAMRGETDYKTGKKYIDSLPQDLADAVVQARQNIVVLQEALIQSGLLPAEIEAVISTTLGSWTKRSYYAFELRKDKSLLGFFKKQKTTPWFESVPEKVRAQARKVFASMAMNGTLDSGFNILLNNYKKNFEDPFNALIAIDPNMQSSATQQASMAMKNELVKLEQKALEFADSIMRKIEDVNQNGDVAFSLGGSIVTMKDYIEKNPSLPKELREYLGEIKDPAINFRLSAMKLTRMLYNHQTVAQFKNLGIESGDVVLPTEPTPAGWIKLGEISKSDTKRMKGSATDEVDAVNRYGALKGCSVTPGMYSLLFETPIEGNAYYKFVTSRVKKYKTLYSPSTQIKNWYGYTFFGLISGAVPEGIYYSKKVFSPALKSIGTPEGFMAYWNEIFSEAKKRGINTSLDIEEINRTGKELSQNKEMLASLKNSNNPANTIYQFFASGFEAIENVSKKGMMLGDAIPKTIMFEIFRNATAAEMNNTSYYELSDKQKEFANEYASRRVKRTTVTDSRTIKGIDYLQRKVGIFGTFPRFMSESIRNFVNAHMLVVDPSVLHEGLVASDNPTEDAEIKKRLNIKTKATGFMGLAGYYGLIALLKAAIAFGDDDDEKMVADIPTNGVSELISILNKPKGTITKTEAIRNLLPEYDKFADLSFKVNENGTVEYVNNSSTDPFNIFPQAYRAFLYSENIGTGAVNAAKQVVVPTLGWEILFGTGLEIIKNENSKGNNIYKNFDDLPSQSLDALAYAFRKAGPGIATSYMRYQDLVKSGVKSGGPLELTGFMSYEGLAGRVSSFNLESKLKSNVSRINNLWIDDQRNYKTDFYKGTSEEERKELNKQRDENAKLYAYELNQLVLSGYALGMTTGEIKKVFKEARVSKKVRKAAMRGGSSIDNLNINDIKED